MWFIRAFDQKTFFFDEKTDNCNAPFRRALLAKSPNSSYKKRQPGAFASLLSRRR